MTHNTFTKGPWHVLDDGSCVVDSKGISVITRPNVRLIAAAPELLEAAQDAFATLLRLRERGTIGDSPSIRLLGAAIKKARGES